MKLDKALWGFRTLVSESISDIGALLKLCSQLLWFGFAALQFNWNTQEGS